jgi:hypothetical protein
MGSPDPDGRHDDLDAADLDGLAMLVPDDPRSLDADRTAYLRELTGRRRSLAGGLGEVNGTGQSLRLPSGARWLLPLLAVMVVIATAALMLTVLPGSSVVPEQAPLATPSAAAGEPGGLLPADPLLINGLPVETAAIRPAVLLLVPADCSGCTETIRDVYRQASEFRLTTVLVGTPQQREQLAQADRDAAGLAAAVALDPRGRLAETYRASGLTVLAVHADGVVGAVLTDVAAGQRLEGAFAVLAEPGAR